MPFVMLLAYNNFYAINAIREQVAASNKNVVGLYLNQIDSNLSEIDKYLADLAGTDTDISQIESYSNEDESVLANVRLKIKISKDILLYKYIDGLFIYSMPKREFILAKNGADYSNAFNDPKTSIKNIIERNPHPNSFFAEGWMVEQVDEKYYFVRILKKGNTYVGSWIEADQLLAQINDGNFGVNGISVFVTEHGEPMNYSQHILANGIDLKQNFQKHYLTGIEHKFLVVGEKSEEGSFSIAAITQDSKILTGYPYIERIVIFVAAATLILMPIYLFVLRKTVLIPINRILTVMKRIRKGNLKVRIEQFKTSEEFLLLNETFNDMLTQIQNLKIDIYEEKITRQKAELEHLQLQVKPHFFLNTLNIMNTLARTKNYELLQEMSMCLVEYFRYMFRSNTPFVFLKDELRHVKNYIRIQEMRFPKSLSTKIDIPEFLMDASVPPLIIHTFVENTIKHSVTLDEPIQLSIKVSVIDRNEKDYIRIIIQDTGKGFAEDIIGKIQAGHKIIDEQGEHIGIRNVQRRLSILYEGQAEFICTNSEGGGAIIEMLLPKNI
ncbi:sensor histidine kinase [Anaerobacterium chartisolvens]|nr:histidine kinase [Anaerobacterium chartisolvens]